MKLLIWICVFVLACLHVCLCVLSYICPQPDSWLEETPISPVLLVPAAFAPYSWQCEEEIWLILGWSLSPHPSHISSFLAVSRSHPLSSLSQHQLCVCVPGFLALTSWLGSHSGTVAPRPKQGLMSDDTLFSPFPLWAYNRRTLYGHSSVFIVLGMLIVFLQQRIHTIRWNRDNLTTFPFSSYSQTSPESPFIWTKQSYSLTQTFYFKHGSCF